MGINSDRKNKPRRGSKFRASVVDRLCHGIELGLTAELACQYAGIHRSTFYEWRRRGEEQTKGRYRDLLNRIAEAEARCAIKCLARVQQAAKDQWQAAAWILERRHGYRAQAGLELTGRDGGPVGVEVSSLVDVVRAAKAAKAAKE